MRAVTAGDGTDSTAAVLAWQQANRKLPMATVYLVGRPENPLALWLTDYETPLCWLPATREKRNPNGTPAAFDPAVIQRNNVKSQIGFDVAQLEVTWTPSNIGTFTKQITTASPYQLAMIGYYDNWDFRSWTVYMPTPGDAHSFGCSELFGGHVGKVNVARGRIKFTVNTFLDVVNQFVPTNVIELLNTGASYTGATPPAGYTRIPQFAAGPGSSETAVIGIETSPTPGAILDANLVRGGYMVFNRIPPDPAATPPVLGSTLDGCWSPILQNATATSGGAGGGGTNMNQFILTAPLPWAPTPGRDSFYVSGAAPINKEDGSYLGFPYVPSPTSSV